MSDNILLCDEKDGSHWVLTLSRPEKRNALSHDLVTALLERIELAREKNIPTLILQGEGRNFSAGFDFSDHESLSRADLLFRFVRVQELLSSLLTYPGLTVGIAHGRNFGAGCDLFAACKVRLARPKTMFRMPGVLFGLVLGTRRFGELVGASHASRILLSAEEFNEEEALRIGFATDVIPEEGPELQTIVQAVAQLPSATRKGILGALESHEPYEDMGRLVMSVMEGDIQARLAGYLKPKR